PTSFILIDQFPVTVNGKIDTTALIEQLDTYQQDQNTAPNTDTQIELAHIWAELLSINFSAIYLESSFFELGGHSLLMIKLSKLIDERFNINMKATVVIEAENLEILALSVDKAITESV
ncbi:phosphopantetheine-binding protein, partial [Pseudoalteromonas ruthenica]